MTLMFLAIGNLDLTEVVVVLVVAIIVFGRNLPRVAARAAVQFGRARRSMQTLWRETGIEDEIRTVQAEIRDNVPRGTSPSKLAREATRRLAARIDEDADAVPDGGEKPPGQVGGEAALAEGNEGTDAGAQNDDKPTDNTSGDRAKNAP